MYGLTAACGELGISWVNGFDMEVYRRAILDCDPEFICPLALIYVTKGGRGRRDERNQTKETIRRRNGVQCPTTYRYKTGIAKGTRTNEQTHARTHMYDVRTHLFHLIVSCILMAHAHECAETLDVRSRRSARCRSGVSWEIA